MSQWAEPLLCSISHLHPSSLSLLCFLSPLSREKCICVNSRLVGRRRRGRENISMYAQSPDAGMASAVEPAGKPKSHLQAGEPLCVARGTVFLLVTVPYPPPGTGGKYQLALSAPRGLFPGDKPGVSFPVTLFLGSLGMAFSKDPPAPHRCGCTAKALLL